MVTKKNKFLWAYGLLLFLGQAFNVSYSVSSQTQERWRGQFNNLFDHEWLVWGLIALSALWLLIYFRARAGIILAVKSLLDREPVQPLAPFYLGRFFVGRMLGLTIILQLGSLILGLLVSTPVIYLFSKGLDNRAMILGLLALLIILPFIFLIVYLNILGSLFVVFYNLPLRASLAAAGSLIGSVWRKLLAIGLMVLGLRILVLAVAAAVSAPFVIFVKMPYYLPVVLAAIIFLAVGAVFTSFEQAVWVRMFTELVKPQKTEEREESEVVPETIV